MFDHPPRLTAVGTAVPPHVLSQPEARARAQRVFGRTGRFEERLLAVFDHSGIETRHGVMPFDWYMEPRSFAERNRLYAEHATDLGRAATERALERARLAPPDLDLVVFVSTTGLATPSLDVHLANALGFRSGIARTPLWGLGCSGAVAGLARAAAFARAEPTARVLLVAVEICSLNFQPDDPSPKNLVGSALFGDGAAAVVIEGAASSNRPGALDLVAAGSLLWPDSTQVMGWEFDEHGLHLVLSRDIPTIVRDCFRPVLDRFLAGLELSVHDVDHVLAHPGGVRVLDALEEALERAPGSLRHAREILRGFGNMSSPTCLFVLERALAAGEIAPGDTALVAALGAGFSAEFVLARRPPVAA